MPIFGQVNGIIKFYPGIGRIKMMKYDRKPSHGSGYLLWQVSNIWQRKINELLTEYSITHVQYLLLATIIWMEERNLTINQISLARHAHSHKMMTSKVLRSLERNGYIKREEDPADSRSKNVTITDKGRQKYFEVRKIFDNEDKLFFDKVEKNRFSLTRIFIDMIEENQNLESPSKV